METRSTRGAQLALIWVVVCACLFLLLPAANGDDVAANGRQVVERWQNAVVTVRLVIKTTFAMPGSESHEEEQKSDVNGTAVDPGGLTVISLSEADPSEMFKRMARQGSEGQQVNVESRVTDVKIRLADGTEVPAKVVLRDKDLDLAFVRPAEKLPQPIAAVDLTQAAAPQLLDQVLTVNRLGDFGDWVIAPRVDRIQAILAKPRTVYVPQDSDRSGTPVFMLDGKIVGVTVLRMPSSAAAQGAMEDFGGLMVILPAADILEVAKQALAAQ